MADSEAKPVKPLEQMAEISTQASQADDDEDSGGQKSTADDVTGISGQTDNINIQHDHLLDINKYRFNNKFKNYL